MPDTALMNVPMLPSFPFLKYVMDTNRLNTAGGERRQSRKMAALLVGCITSLAMAADVDAQATAADSIAERLRRAEAAIATLQQQLSEQSENAAKARSGVHLELTGRVMVGGFGNSRRVNNVDNPQFVRPDTTPGVPVRGVGMAIRQTRLGVAVRARGVMGGTFDGDVDVDFYGGQQPSSGGRTFPLLRLRTARGIVRWSNAHLLIGQESPLISELNPVTPAAIGTPDFATAGNLWLWLPQLRIGIESRGGLRVGIDGAVLAPTSGDAVAAFDTDYDLAERSQRPFFQGRVHVGWSEGETRGEIGCGAHAGWLVPSPNTRLMSRALACDLLAPIREWLEVRGEIFSGRGIRGLGGGAIGQNFTSTNALLGTNGGWAQLNLRPTSSARAGAGCGSDDPVALATRLRNDACAVYAILRPAGPLFYGGEFRRLRTEYSAARFTNDHVTLAAGFEF